MCTGGIRKPSSSVSFRRTARMRFGELAAAGRVDQRDQPEADLETEQVGRAHVVPAELALGARGGFGCRTALSGAVPARWRCQAKAPSVAPSAQEDDVGHAGHEPEHADQRRGDGERPRVLEQLPRDLLAHVAAGGDAGDDDGRAHRQHQRRDLGDEAVADRQQRVVVRRLPERQPVLAHADREAPPTMLIAEHEEPRDRVALDELARPVHRAVEVRLLRDLGAPPSGLLLIDDAGR